MKAQIDNARCSNGAATSSSPSLANSQGDEDIATPFQIASPSPDSAKARESDKPQSREAR